MQVTDFEPSETRFIYQGKQYGCVDVTHEDSTEVFAIELDQVPSFAVYPLMQASGPWKYELRLGEKDLAECRPYVEADGINPGVSGYHA